MAINDSQFYLALAVGLAAWVKFSYDWFQTKPKIEGNVIGLIRGHMNDPNKPRSQLATFLTVLILTNARKRSVHILNYEMQVGLVDRLVTLTRVYGMEDLEDAAFLTDDGWIDIPDFKEKLIHGTGQPVQYGVPMLRYLVFATEDLSLYDARIDSLILTLTDVFNRKHIVRTHTSELPSILQLMDLTGIRTRVGMKPP